MSPIAQIASALLGLWFLSSVCYAFRVPGVSTVLIRLNGCRAFSTWTMFASRVGAETGTYAVEYCDRHESEAADVWSVAARGCYWHPLGFLLHPKKPIAEAIQQIGRLINHAARRAADPGHAAVLLRCEAALIDYLARTHPAPARGVREIRLVKQRSNRPDQVIWWFVVRPPSPS